jgi:DNA polymerase III alpha subunit
MPQPTDTSPELSLLFERFLDGSRGPMPDIDLNFAREDRAAVAESPLGRFRQPTS